jgi:hypothetical protein
VRESREALCHNALCTRVPPSAMKYRIASRWILHARGGAVLCSLTPHLSYLTGTDPAWRLVQCTVISPVNSVLPLGRLCAGQLQKHSRWRWVRLVALAGLCALLVWCAYLWLFLAHRTVSIAKVLPDNPFDGVWVRPSTESFDPVTCSLVKCPRDYPFPSRGASDPVFNRTLIWNWTEQQEAVCFKEQSHAIAGTGPVGGWCTKEPAIGADPCPSIQQDGYSNLVPRVRNLCGGRSAGEHATGCQAAEDESSCASSCRTHPMCNGYGYHPENGTRSCCLHTCFPDMDASNGSADAAHNVMNGSSVHRNALYPEAQPWVPTHLETPAFNVSGAENSSPALPTGSDLNGLYVKTVLASACLHMGVPVYQKGGRDGLVVSEVCPLHWRYITHTSLVPRNTIILQHGSPTVHTIEESLCTLRDLF